jgi:hypothetical protein
MGVPLPLLLYQGGGGGVGGGHKEGNRVIMT